MEAVRSSWLRRPITPARGAASPARAMLVQDGLLRYVRSVHNREEMPTARHALQILFTMIGKREG